ncbi:MAG: hypothetical protein KDA45_10900 [Planctomycetales bacterium]|nr:hypothetical protein [Planctomycetales bacterium]
MSQSYRSGSSRLLSKTLDDLDRPLAIVDRRGGIVFANESLCGLAQAEGSELVGKQVSWQLAEDDSPFAALLTALAPPAGALQGKLTARQLTAPVVFGSTHTGQLFLPLVDGEGSVQATVVILGDWPQIRSQLPPAEALSLEHKLQQENALVELRSRWQTLDGLQPLFGSSPAMRLAMTRVQLAVRQPCSLFVAGPRGVGKTDLIRALFAARLRQAGIPKIGGQLFPVACGVLDAELFEGMLEVFAARQLPQTPPSARLLLLEQLDRLPLAGVEILNRWLDTHGQQCCVASASECSVAQLAARDVEWAKLLVRIATLEVSLPPLQQRREDIPTLARHFLSVLCQQKGRAPLVLSAEAMQLLTAFPWPENLRQLAEVIDQAMQRAVMVSAIGVQHLPAAFRAFASTAQASDREDFEPIDLDQVLQDLERIILQRALHRSPRNRAQVARWLGISRPRLLRRISQLGLDSQGEGSPTGESP